MELQCSLLAWSGVEKSERAKASIAIFTQKNLVKNIQDIQYINERYLRLDVKIYSRDIIFRQYTLQLPILLPKCSMS